MGRGEESREDDAVKMEAKNKERFERLRALAPIEAVKAWLDGDFGIDDEPAMISAIRKDPRISLSDDGIIDAVCEAMDEGLDAQACLEHFNKRCSRISR